MQIEYDPFKVAEALFAASNKQVPFEEILNVSVEDFFPLMERAGLTADQALAILDENVPQFEDGKPVLEVVVDTSLVKFADRAPKI